MLVLAANAWMCAVFADSEVQLIATERKNVAAHVFSVMNHNFFFISARVSS